MHRKDIFSAVLSLGLVGVVYAGTPESALAKKAMNVTNEAGLKASFGQPLAKWVEDPQQTATAWVQYKGAGRVKKINVCLGVIESNGKPDFIRAIHFLFAKNTSPKVAADILGLKATVKGEQITVPGQHEYYVLFESKHVAVAGRGGGAIRWNGLPSLSFCWGP